MARKPGKSNGGGTASSRGGGGRGSGGGARSGGGGGLGLEAYFRQSQEPLQILFFLVPMLIFYEVGTRLWATTPDGRIIPVEAYARLNKFFNLTGLDSAGWYVPGAAMVIMLLVWHIMSRKAWQIHLGVAAGMVVEAAALALPLIVLDQLMLRLAARLAGGGSEGAMMMSWDAGGTAAMLVGQISPFDLEWKGRLVLSIGAGLYEEMLFRLLFLAGAHTLLVNLLGAKAERGMIAAVGLSALAFTFYHDVHDASGGLIWRLVVFYFVFGLYSAGVLLTRGFGIVVGAHAAYDILVLIVQPAMR